MKKKWFLLLNLSVLSILSLTDVKAQSYVSEKESAGVFVQKFYDWYLVQWAQKKPSRQAVHEVAIKQRAEDFDVRLKRAIAEDDIAQNKADGIVGLDFDPFLKCQELWGNYQTGDVKQIGERFWIDIHNIEKGKSKKEIKNAPLRVVVELQRKNRQWIFINFIYPSEKGETNPF